MISATTLKCLLCKSPEVRFLFKKRSIPFYKCADCEFIFSRPEINANLSNQITDFEPAYLDYFQEKETDTRNHAALVALLKRHVDFYSSRILDIGCGSGKLVRYLRSKECDAYGLEPSVALFNAFLKQDNFFFHDSVSNFAQHHDGNRFNLIILSDVIEHIPDPEDFVRNIESLLSAGGVLFITTPDTKSLLAKSFGKYWHYYNKYHLSLFNRTNLKQVLAIHSLSQVECGYVSRQYSLSYLFKYALNFVFNKEMNIPTIFKKMFFPLNLFDNFYGIYKKK